MKQELQGKRVAFLVANEGIEQVELTDPWRAVEEAGAQPVLIAPEPGEAQAFHHLDMGDTFTIDLTAAEARPEEYDALVLPGGVANPDQLRTNPEAVALVRSFVEAGKPVAAICHGPWTLVEGGVIEGRTLTSWPSLATDIRNAGGEWVDEELHIDLNGPGPIITSRKPDDLKAFGQAIVESLTTP